MPVSDLFRNPKHSPLSFPTPKFQSLSRPIRSRASFPTHISLNHLGLHRRRLLGFPSKPNYNVYAENSCSVGLDIDADEFLEVGDRDLPVDLCFTRTLPPALTLREGYEKIRKAVEDLKVNPPCSSSGVLRYQVLVPPSTKALNLLCCKCKDLSAYPQFYFSTRQNHEVSLELASLDRLLEVSGVGASICVRGSSHILKGYSFLGRYLSSDSHLIRAYGSIGLLYDKKQSSMEDKIGSFYFFIPQLELNEFDGCSLLASTMVWDDSISYTFERAVYMAESHIHQQMINFGASVSVYDKESWIKHVCGQPYSIENKDAQMVYLNAEVLARIDAEAKCMQKEEPPTFYQSYIQYSPTYSFTANMCFGSNLTNLSVKETSNINLAWASLIVEECVRLGLTYFCIAPGSRSSPLAISACGHSLTTCISCYDERSLGFHAVGYARGSNKPAVVITSSGTAVSNLLPAVVEASQDFVPLVLLTADRPPELHDTGANQAIDQVNHFGKFVRFFFSLPPPTDQITARMVLTTIDAAVYSATQAPHGPVHINCPFREPLECHREWTLECLRGLDLWLTSMEPFTSYMRMQRLDTWNINAGPITEVFEVIQRSNRGLLLIGSIHCEDEIWAAIILAKHLSWPVVADILSGLRLRRTLTSSREFDNILFIDHLDQAMLSDSVKRWAQPDVVVQIGSRITSKRIGQFLEFCSPPSYILVDRHPCRHDPSHIVTHRIQSTISEFADALCKIHLPKKRGTWANLLKELNSVVGREIAFQLQSELLLTEPYVAHVIGETLDNDAAIFVGNSMVIRDLDMYGRGWLKSANNREHLLSYNDPFFHGIQVAGNRGASGIDGLLSTAIGFAVGCNKRVLCMIGDVSFLHDTNGLSLLSQRARRKPITVIIINNHGGAIFSLLPVADVIQSDILNKYFYTAHDVSISKLCAAHSVKHVLVQTKEELQVALVKSQQEQSDSVIEVQSCIADNANFHSGLNISSRQAANQALGFLLGVSHSKHADNGLSLGRIMEMDYMLYRIQLSVPPTSRPASDVSNELFREGFILIVSLDDNSIGFGEVAPIEIHEENLLDVEEQLNFLHHRMKGCDIGCLLPLLKGSFSSWIWRSLGIPPSSLYPSVRCGLEMAILNALAARCGSNLSDLVSGCMSSYRDTKSVKPGNSASIDICALVDCNGNPAEVAHVVSQLVDEGFTTIKLKVARRENPIDDAAVIQKIREVVGYKVNIRVDANQKWTYEEAILFGSKVKCFNLQYIEEPVDHHDDIIKFCEDSGLPVALDETIDNLKGDVLHQLQNFVHPGIVALVIKPSVVGGFENTALIAEWAQLHDKVAVVSSAFESSLSLLAYVQFAHYLEIQHAAVCQMKKRVPTGVMAHGLGTYRWLKEDVTDKGINTCIHPNGGRMEASVEDAHNLTQYFQINNERIQRTCTEEQLRSCYIQVDGNDLSCLFKLQEAGSSTNRKVVIFLHGFLGASQDWIPIMKALSPYARTISVDLPGHGESLMQWHIDGISKEEFKISIEFVAGVLIKLISDITDGGVILVGYSMGARIALHMALKYTEKVNGAVIISGSPGLKDEARRRIRNAQDKSRACFLLSYGFHCFLDSWYSGNIWRSIREHPHFESIRSNRAKHNDVKTLAKVLCDSSIGQQRSLWEDLKHSEKPLLFIVGEQDIKFREIAQQMCREIKGKSEGEGYNQREKFCEKIIVPDCGHAVHLENPLAVINAVRKFLTKLD
ncbi:protein PHYLLO, chloroplastic isoform X2 [Typha latifolia]|uniref:protein PHYLLO, chloroplastic isoform X2 n=1 Tax=Typha latifolia TaxID=4733 RepID=UPI003C30489C